MMPTRRMALVRMGFATMAGASESSPAARLGTLDSVGFRMIIRLGKTSTLTGWPHA